MGEETIVAIATPRGRAGIGVVRVSGSRVRAITKKLCGRLPEPRRAHLVRFAARDGAPIDRGLALFFAAPHSFTGEDVVELSAHASPVLLDLLVRRVCELGARPARAGEFSERAFLNGKLDLAQAEAVADLIAARSAAQVRAAQRSLAGEFSRRVDKVAEAVTGLRVEVEAAIDFAEDAAEGASPAKLARLFTEAATQLEALLAAAQRGVRLTDGLDAVIVGAPNVGKSSLMNALAGSDRAIVSALPGTTRDVLRESIAVGGIELTLADTAGLREATDAVEGEGIRRARVELARADVILHVLEEGAAPDPDTELGGDSRNAVRIVIVNKIDLAPAEPWRAEAHGVVTIGLSARTGAGLDLLRDELRRIAAGSEIDGAFSARGRHVDALERARARLASAQAGLALQTPELVADDLRYAQQALGEITGTFTTEDLLGAIFSTFCVGK